MNANQIVDKVLGIIDNYNWNRACRQDISSEITKILETDNVNQSDKENSSNKSNQETIDTEFLTPELANEQQREQFKTNCSSFLESIVIEKIDYKRKDVIRHIKKLMSKEKLNANNYTIFVCKNVISLLKKMNDSTYNNLRDRIIEKRNIGEIVEPKGADKLQLEEFENKCMDVIEAVVSENQEYERKDAIKRSQELLEAEQAKSENEYSILVHQRVLQEFRRASDEEYIALRKQIFS